MSNNKILRSIILCGLLAFPILASADIVDIVALPGQSDSVSQQASPLNCYFFQKTLSRGSHDYDVRALQYALIQEGMNIPTSEYGVFGRATEMAVMTFQQKYAGDILRDGGAPTGIVGSMTRAKLNLLYRCGFVSVSTIQTAALPSKISLQIKDTVLDDTGVTGTFCNLSSGDLPVFPVRLRLNGIVRDFNISSVLQAGSCSTESLPYSAWGLEFDPNSTYALVSAIDPTNMYKTSSLNYSLSATTTLAIPAVAGYHLSIRGVQIKSSGLQATFCNLGDQDLTSFPVRIVINGIARDFDLPSMYIHGKCQSVTWPFSTWSISSASGTLIKANINVDPDNIYKETNEFDNAASIVGTI